MPPGVLKLARELLHNGSLACASSRDISDGNHLHPQRGVAQDAEVVQDSPRFDGNGENFREGIKGSTKQGSAFPFALPVDYFQDELLKRF